MTKIYKIPFVFLILGLFSCSDDEVELPRSEPDFNIDPAIAEVGVPIMFENLTINASRYEWSFGDNGTSEETSPTHIYEKPGTFTVTLKAYTNDNQMDSVVKEIDVGQRVLMGIEIQSVASLNNENAPWDPVETADTTKYPDLIVAMGSDENPDLGGAWYFGPDAEPRRLPRSITVDSENEPVILTKESWYLVFYDFDGEDIANLDPDKDLEFMFGFQDFNPVTIPISEVNEEGLGLIQLAGRGYHINLFFEIR